MAYKWSEMLPPLGKVKGKHIRELQEKTNLERQRRGMPATQFSGIDDEIDTIESTYLDEIRNSIDEIEPRLWCFYVDALFYDNVLNGEIGSCQSERVGVTCASVNTAQEVTVQQAEKSTVHTSVLSNEVEPFQWVYVPTHKNRLISRNEVFEVREKLDVLNDLQCQNDNAVIYNGAKMALYSVVNRSECPSYKTGYHTSYNPGYNTLTRGGYSGW